MVDGAMPMADMQGVCVFNGLRQPRSGPLQSLADVLTAA